VLIRGVVVTAFAFVGSLVPWTVAGAGDVETSSLSHAVFEEGTLDLTSSWGEAEVCIELTDHAECFRSEAELSEEFPAFAPSPGDVVTLASCSSSLRLYRSTGFTGGTLVLTTRGVVHNLSAYGFDNDTSSYRVGACASTFWAGASGSGAVYPGPTGAFASASQMLIGWNNAVSSVYIS
jgi:hypothetical protein